LFVNYTENAASEKEILDHLMRCSANFIPPLEKWVELSSYSKKIHEKANTFEAWVGSTLVGLVAAYFNAPDQTRGFITSVSTAAEYMGNGIASKLMNLVILYAKDNRFNFIDLEVYKDNTAAINFYKRFGFYQHEAASNSILMRLDIEVN